MGMGFIPVRKKGKLPPPVISRDYELEYGTDTLEIKPGEGKVIIVDDVYATGGTAKATRELCEEAGYDVIDEVYLINLSFLNKDKVKSVITY
jgi:adenine phosphoribosyltransferase